MLTVLLEQNRPQNSLRQPLSFGLCSSKNSYCDYDKTNLVICNLK